MSNLPTLSAGEVGRYVYCARSWWLRRVMGHRPTNLAALERGQDRHDRHGQMVASGGRKIALARWLGLAALLLVIVLLLSLRHT